MVTSVFHHNLRRLGIHSTIPVIGRGVKSINIFVQLDMIIEIFKHQLRITTIKEQSLHLATIPKKEAA